MPPPWLCKNHKLKQCIYDDTLYISPEYSKTETPCTQEISEIAKINAIKNKINFVNQESWSKIRKYTNLYESPLNIIPHKIHKKPISRAFYKLWEILYDFKLYCNSDTLHLCEAPGGFAQAVVIYKSKKYKTVKPCYISSLNSKNKSVPRYNSTIRDDPNVHIVWNGDGDLTSVKNIVSMKKEMLGKSVTLITADGGICEHGDFNNKETLHVRLILSEIFTACLLLDDFGNFVIKIFDINTDVTRDMVYLLTQLFKEVYISKPLTSRPTNSEKYIVCKGYVKNKFCVNLKNDILKCLCKLENEPDIKLCRLFSEIKPNPSYIQDIASYNKSFIKTQIHFIEKNLNYLGEKFEVNLDKNKKQCAKKWIMKYNLKAK